MTYVIEGTLVKEEKPDKYMNKFVDFKLIEDIHGGSTTTKRRYITTTSERFAHWLNNRGCNLQWNKDLERAVEMCARREVGVSKTKLFSPGSGWEAYLTHKFRETKEEKTLEGNLRVWEETRLPIPWLYVASFGKLKDVFVFDDVGFVVEPMTNHEGKKFTAGIVLDIPILYLGVSQTRTKTQTSRYGSF